MIFKMICCSAIIAACLPVGWIGLYLIGQIRDQKEEMKKLSPEDRVIVEQALKGN